MITMLENQRPRFFVRKIPEGGNVDNIVTDEGLVSIYCAPVFAVLDSWQQEDTENYDMLKSAVEVAAFYNGNWYHF